MVKVRKLAAQYGGRSEENCTRKWTEIYNYRNGVGDRGSSWPVLPNVKVRKSAQNMEEDLRRNVSRKMCVRDSLMTEQITLIRECTKAAAYRQHCFISVYKTQLDSGISEWIQE